MALHRILVADDEESMRWVLSKALRKKGYSVDLAADGNEALRQVREQSYDLAIVDIKMPGMSGLDFLDKAREVRSDLLVVVMTAEASMKNAVEAMKRGAYDYITKPFDLEVVDAIIEKVSRARDVSSQVSLLKQELKDRYQVEKNIVGNSPAMREVYKTIGKVAVSDVTVLIQGESGTGKELIARAIHFNSSRLGKPFVAINCAAIPKDLLESELFGSERGAFTGATERKTGKFEQANHGTIFLDEIGDMPLDLQAKILRVLQEQEITRIGGSQNLQVDVRVVAATNQELLEKVRNREFREDLFYRLNVVPIHLVPLRERREDIRPLVDYFLARASAELETQPKQCSDEAMELLCNHSWPGNVRELENTIKRAVILSNDPLLTPSDFGGLFDRQQTIHAAPEEQSLEAIVEAKLRSSMNGIEKLDKGDIYDRVLEQVERPLIRFTLEKTRGNQVRAADILGINRNTLRKKINDLGIQLKKD
ncbi:sigma-54 dependent transcriptional regulator [Trichlorobacter sp.]|uniref:sigma-54-dependent transcriptional regulator n=1 Tax=Trichlorobacter sp. TaxID=2911007 RepID=UPI00243950FD|nr:sigma-54 dependent transcriptional regulator [Trichlorobacter sp.]MCB5247323.1 sigma-54 dependent transcriptional regulator [Candidatus Cloacimonadota bacterium]MDY0384059.1 sigma-54 dependent transcriptional regulator [Trichlorobacter sp.]